MVAREVKCLMHSTVTSELALFIKFINYSIIILLILGPRPAASYSSGELEKYRGAESSRYDASHL